VSIWLLVRDRGEVECIDSGTGKTIWEAAFPKHRSNYYASPLISGGKLYAPREDGTVFVASVANDKFELCPKITWPSRSSARPSHFQAGFSSAAKSILFCIASE
jgi:outer membrane protein assembly factor BamB